jgi:hypothetical protein
MRVITLLLGFICLVPITVLANNVTVGCGVPGTFDYNSVTLALTGLHSISNRNHTITISGACVERVDVTDFENVSLIGTPGAMITASPMPRWMPSVQVALSKNIKITDLVIQGVINPSNPTPPVIKVTDSSVDILRCTIQGGVNPRATNYGYADGVVADANSRVNITGSEIKDNQGAGIIASGNSSVQFSGSNARKAVIQSNVHGVMVSGGSSVNIVSETNVLGDLNYWVEVLDNVVNGISAGGNVTFSGGGQKKIANNAMGLSASGGFVWGNNLLIENNREVGVNSFLGGTIWLRNATIDNNGGPTSSLPFAAGVMVDVNSKAMFVNVTISNSPVTGLLVRDNASVILSGSTITGNGADGIRIETLSGVRFQITPTTVIGNSGSDLVCDSSAYAVGGSFATVGNDKCPQFKRK